MSRSEGGAVRKVVLQMQISVDGFVAGPNGELDWVFESIDEATTAWIVERLRQAGVHIMAAADVSGYGVALADLDGALRRSHE
jgi:hypothetical protein